MKTIITILVLSVSVFSGSPVERLRTQTEAAQKDRLDRHVTFIMQMVEVAASSGRYWWRFNTPDNLRTGDVVRELKRIDSRFHLVIDNRMVGVYWYDVD